MAEEIKSAPEAEKKLTAAEIKEQKAKDLRDKIHAMSDDELLGERRAINDKIVHAQKKIAKLQKELKPYNAEHEDRQIGRAIEALKSGNKDHLSEILNIVGISEPSLEIPKAPKAKKKASKKD